jgi:hypothetical protein
MSRFDMFTRAFAVAHYRDAFLALVGMASNPFCAGQKCNGGHPCKPGCRCSLTSGGVGTCVSQSSL